MVCGALLWTIKTCTATTGIPRTSHASGPGSKSCAHVSVQSLAKKTPVRPYGTKTAGVPLLLEYVIATCAFQYSWSVCLWLRSHRLRRGNRGCVFRSSQDTHHSNALAQRRRNVGARETRTRAQSIVGIVTHIPILRARCCSSYSRLSPVRSPGSGGGGRVRSRMHFYPAAGGNCQAISGA